MNTDTLMIQIETGSKNAEQSIDSLITKLESLNTSLQNVITTARNLSKLKVNIGLNTGSSSTKYNRSKQPFAEYGTKESQFKDLGISESSLGKVIDKTKTATQETTRYKDAMGRLVTVVKKSKNGLDGYKVTLKEVGNQAKNNTSIFKSLTSGINGTIVKVGLFWHSIKAIGTGIGELTANAAGYYESLNLFTTTLGNKAEEGMEWVEKFSDTLYLDPAQTLKYMGSFNSLVKGLGVGEEKAYLMSQQLTQLTYDLASFKNLGFQESFEKLMSGVSGEIICLVRKGLRTVTHLIQWTSKHVMV